MRSGVTQVTPTSSPDIRITIGEDAYTSQDSGRLLRAYLDEQVWGGQYIFEIDNSDETLTSKDYVGSSATIHLSFVGSSGSDMSPVWVHNQQLISKEGKLILQLNCIDAWGLLSQVNADLASAAYNQNWQQSSELDERTLPSGEPIPSALKTAIEANYDRTIFSIIEDLIEDTLSISVTLDDDDGIVDTRKPPIRISNPVSGVRQLLDMTESYLKWKTNGTFGVYQPSNHATVYTFNAANLIFNNLEDVAVTIPNRVTFYSFDSDGDEWINGTPAVDSDSYTALGVYVDRHYLLANLDIDGRSDTTSLTALAAGALTKIQGERSQGVVVAPMHCSLELFDKIQVDDYYYDTPRSTTGYIHRLIREYDRGVYRVTIQLGGVTGGYTLPGGNVPVPLADDTTPDNPVPDAPTDVPVGYQSYIADVDFTSVDWDTVSWAAGTVYFGDGSSQSIDSGSFDMTADGAWYFYAIYGNSTLQHTQTATDVTGDSKVLVAVASRGSTTDYNAYVLNPFTDSILINTDKVMDGLVTTLKLSNEAVTNAKIAVNAIQGDVIAASAITETKISNNAISTGKLQAGAITAGKIDTGAVTATKIATDAVTASKIDADAVTAQAIAAGAVTTIKLDAYAVEAGKIASNAITSDKIYAGAITADKLTATLTLSTTIQTASSGTRVVLNSGGMDIYGQVIEFRTTGGTLGGWIASNTSFDLTISAITDMTIQCSGDITIGASVDKIDMYSANKLILPHMTGEPTGSDGMMVFNSSTGYLNVYSSTYGDWWHVNRDADWA